MGHCRNMFCFYVLFDFVSEPSSNLLIAYFCLILVHSHHLTSWQEFADDSPNGLHLILR